MCGPWVKLIGESGLGHGPRWLKASTDGQLERAGAGGSGGSGGRSSGRRWRQTDWAGSVGHGPGADRHGPDCCNGRDGLQRAWATGPQAWTAGLTGQNWASSSFENAIFSSLLSFISKISLSYKL